MVMETSSNIHTNRKKSGHVDTHHHDLQAKAARGKLPGEEGPAIHGIRRNLDLEMPHGQVEEKVIHQGGTQNRKAQPGGAEHKTPAPKGTDGKRSVRNAGKAYRICPLHGSKNEELAWIHPLNWRFQESK